MTELTSNFGWPYPERGSNPDPADMPDGLRDLAEAVEVTLRNLETRLNSFLTTFGKRPVYQARRTAAISLAAGAFVPVPMDTVDVDMFSTSRPSGYYLVGGGLAFATVAGEGGERVAALAVNGTVVASSGGPAPSTGRPHPVVVPTATLVLQLAPTDLVELRGFQSGTAPLAIDVSAGLQPHLLMVHLAGPWPVTVVP